MQPQTLRSVEIIYKQIKDASPIRAQTIAKLLLRVRSS